MSKEPTGARPRKATGPDRLTYFNTGDVDRVMAVLLALVSEVAAIRDRLDTHERLADQGAAPSVAAVEAFAPAPEAEDQREAWRDGYIRRLFRVISEDLEVLNRDQDPA